MAGCDVAAKYNSADGHMIPALKTGHLPSVSFLKAAEYQDGHAGYSDPVDEQHFLVEQINAIQKSPQWKDTAIVVAYDDSDGWYDHAYAKPLNGSTDKTTGSGGKATDVRLEPLHVEQLSSFGEDARGELYATSLTGTVYKLTG